MKIFQNSVLNKYLKTQDEKKIDEMYSQFTSYFHNAEIQENIRNSKEEQFQEGFLRELFVKILGYTLNPKPNFNLTTELKNEKGAKKTDGAILKNGKALAVIELKGTNTKDLDKVNNQAFNYKNNHTDCIYVITSNFEKLRFFIHNAVTHIEFNLFKLTKLEFKILWLCLSADNLLGDVPAKIKEDSTIIEENITKQLYKDYSTFKNELWQNICKNSPDLDKLLLFKKTQKLLDRFLFIFFAEDSGLLPPNSISRIVEQYKKLIEYDARKPLYEIFKQFFGYLNKGRKGKTTQDDIFAYNGGLFLPDELLDSIRIDDKILKPHVMKMTAYNFQSDIDVNILGHIFENSLNEIENVTAQLEGQKLDKSKSKRKKDGVFYTPKYITKYIVENTVGKLCDEKKAELNIIDEEYAKGRKKRKKTTIKTLIDNLQKYRNWLLEITICDPACGSGAFLNQALEFLINEHTYIDELQASLLETSMVLQDVSNHVLEKNIFGVDINDESVEIAKLSLWLRTAQKGRKLTSLNNNIKCGNSLIDDHEVAGDKAFNWEKEFPQVFKEKEKKAWHITFAIHNSRYSTDADGLTRRFGGVTAKTSGLIARTYPELSPEQEIIIAEELTNAAKEYNLNIVECNICKDHVHAIIVCEKDELSYLVGKWKGRSAFSYNRRIDASVSEQAAKYADGTKEKFWAKSFKPILIKNKQQFETVISYIKNNRQKHELPTQTNGFTRWLKQMCCTYKHAFRPEYKGGFDVIIGNPPYVLCQPSNTNKQTLDYYKSFNVASYKIDLFHLFFEKSIRILIQNGKLGFITPNTYLNNKYIKPLRSFILNKTSIDTVINYKDEVFVDAGVDVATIILTKSKKEDNIIELFEVANYIEKSLGNKEQQIWEKDKENLFNLNKEFIVNFTNCIPLSNICSSYFGIQAYDRKSAISFDKLSDDYLSIIDGGDINNFSYSVPKKFFNYLPELIKSGGDFNVYNEKRIVISQIGFTPIVGICVKGILASNTLYNINLKSTEYDLYYLICILNSTLIKSYWISKYSDGKKLFPKIKGFQLKELPIKVITKEAQQPFIEKADLMLSLNKELQTEKDNFLNTLKEEKGIEKITKKLNAFSELEYEVFKNEVRKQKVKINLGNENNEWREYFSTTKQKVNDLQNKINKTDVEIDKMVYELYELTAEEIEIIENSIK